MGSRYSYVARRFVYHMPYLDSKEIIYWDHNATTPCDPDVLSAMMDYQEKNFGNPSSYHVLGRKALKSISIARSYVADLANCQPDEIIFTSGATESNNLIFLSLMLSESNDRREILTTKIEHPSVLNPMNLLSKYGFNIVYMPVKPNGIIDIDKAYDLINQKTAIVSVQAANHEIGTIQPIDKLSKKAHQVGAFFHTDATQAVGKISIDLQSIDCDFASFSAHKMYGPKGVGALYIKGGYSKWPWELPISGGGQENGIRPGTSNVPGIVGFGQAANIATKRLRSDIFFITALRRRLEERLISIYPECVIHGYGFKRLPGTTSVAFTGIPADLLVANCTNFCLSIGSACSSGALKHNSTVKYLLNDEKIIESTIRISLGRNSKDEEIDMFTDCIKKLKQKLN